MSASQLCANQKVLFWSENGIQINQKGERKKLIKLQAIDSQKRSLICCFSRPRKASQGLERDSSRKNRRNAESSFKATPNSFAKKDWFVSLPSHERKRIEVSKKYEERKIRKLGNGVGFLLITSPRFVYGIKGFAKRIPVFKPSLYFQLFPLFARNPAYLYTSLYLQILPTCKGIRLPPREPPPADQDSLQLAPIAALSGRRLIERAGPAAPLPP